MKKRPLPITIFGFLFIIVGLVGLVYHGSEFKLRSVEYYWILVLRLLAILGGTFLLRGRNWARWLLVAWLGYHVILSFLHTPFELIVHALFLAILAAFLFREPASSYFGSRGN